MAVGNDWYCPSLVKNKKHIHTTNWNRINPFSNHRYISDLLAVNYTTNRTRIESKRHETSKDESSAMNWVKMNQAPSHKPALSELLKSGHPLRLPWPWVYSLLWAEVLFSKDPAFNQQTRRMGKINSCKTQKNKKRNAKLIKSFKKLLGFYRIAHSDRKS